MKPYGLWMCLMRNQVLMVIYIVYNIYYYMLIYVLKKFTFSFIHLEINMQLVVSGPLL